jgi:DNA-binding NarL/FixJ family response regulator
VQSLVQLLIKDAERLSSMPLTILVADDDLGTRLAISDYLEMSGYSVLTAADGREALAIVEAHHPHLMVTDIIMPRLNGYELVRHVRQHPAFRLLPVIFLTSRNQTEERIQGYQSGGDLYLPKPFELPELGAAIRNLLERSQMISEYRLSPEESLCLLDAEKPELPLNLTQREREVIVLLTHGLSNAEIGTHLHLSPRTVEKYVSSLFRKTETSNRAELVCFAMKHRLVE